MAVPIKLQVEDEKIHLIEVVFLARELLLIVGTDGDVIRRSNPADPDRNCYCHCYCRCHYYCHYHYHLAVGTVTTATLLFQSGGARGTHAFAGAAPRGTAVGGGTRLLPYFRWHCHCCHISDDTTTDIANLFVDTHHRVRTGHARVFQPRAAGSNLFHEKVHARTRHTVVSSAVASGSRRRCDDAKGRHCSRQQLRCAVAMRPLTRSVNPPPTAMLELHHNH